MLHYDPQHVSSSTLLILSRTNCITTASGEYAKMADDVNQRVEDALQTLVNITEKSGNLRKDLRNDILESVSTIRKIYSQLKVQLENVKDENKKLNAEVKKATEKATTGRDNHSGRQVAPSMDQRQQPAIAGTRQVLPSEGGRMLYSEAVRNQGENKRYRITLKAKDETTTPDQIKQQLKMNINPTDIKVGIKAVKTIRERGILIETGSEEERNTLSTEISNKLGEKLEVIKHKLRKPRLIIYNVSDEITTENVVSIIKAQNPEILTNGEDIEAKYRFKNRKGRHNIIMEVGPQIRKQILQSRLKIGWEICYVADYLTPTRCFKCSRYNHKHYECKGEETCPHCAGKHKKNECTTAESEQKCINCITYNRYNKEGKRNENHSALNKDCPSLQAVLKRYRDNTEY